MGGKSKKGRKTKPHSSSQAAEASTVEKFEKVFSRIAKSASKGKSIVRVEARELNKTSQLCSMEMALTLFDGSVITGHIPATVEPGDDQTFVTSYANRVIAPALIGHEPTRQKSIDAMLTQFLSDASKDLSDKLKRLARNVNWATSVAVCKAGAYANNMHSYKYVRKLLVCFDSDFKGEEYEIPNYVFCINNNSATITSAPQHLLISHKRGAPQSVEITKSIYDSYFKLGELSVDRIRTLKVNLIKFSSFSFVMGSHSCCESNEPFIADLCVGLMVETMKIGVSCVTSNCKVCDQINLIIKTFPTIRLLGVSSNGQVEFELDGSDDEDEWDKVDNIDD